MLTNFAMSEKHNWISFLCQKKMLLILMLGLSSGLPLGLSGATLQAWYAMEDVSIVTIGFLALVGQPYVYKFIWAPFLDKGDFPYLGFFGLRRGWILAMQVGLILILIAMAFLSPSVNPYHLAFLALCLAFFSATQDIAIDAYRTELLLPEERGIGTSMAVTGYRIAMLISGGLALMLAHYVGFSSAYLIMAGVMSVGVIATFLAKEPVHVRSRVSLAHFWQSCIEPFKEFLSRQNAILFLGFIVLYKLGDAFAGSLTTTFLLKGVGFSLVQVGLVNKSIGMTATLLGVFLGGIIMVRVGLFYALFVFGIIQALTNLLFLILVYTGPDYLWMVSALFLESLGGGLGTAAFMTLIMSLCKPEYAATQFALLSALAAIGRVFVGPLAGLMVQEMGWSLFFMGTVIFAMPGLLLLIYLRSGISQGNTP